jgi:hypothetical protein
MALVGAPAPELEETKVELSAVKAKAAEDLQRLMGDDMVGMTPETRTEHYDVCVATKGDALSAFLGQISDLFAFSFPCLASHSRLSTFSLPRSQNEDTDDESYAEEDDTESVEGAEEAPADEAAAVADEDSMEESEVGFFKPRDLYPFRC